MNILYAMQNTGVDFSADVGASILVKHTIEGLQRAGHHLKVCSLSGLSVRLYANIPNYQDFDLAPTGISGWPLFVLAERLSRRIQVAWKIPYVAAFDSFRFYQAMVRQLPAVDICHEYQGLFSVGTALACRKTGVPLVVTVDADLLLERKVVGRPLKGWHAALARRELNWLYRQARKILCVSEAAKQHLVTAWGVAAEKVVVMPNGVDTTLFHPDYDPAPIRAEWGLGGAPVVGFVGGFQKWHGLDLLVASFARLRERFPHARLLLVGDGPARPDIERAIAAHRLSDCTTITGLMPQARVPHMLAAVDVAVLPYPPLPQELWFSPLKLYEYMAAGKAIVASRAGQIADVLADGVTGLLVESGDVAQLSDAIAALLGNPAERARLGQNARQQAVERHSWARYIERLEAVYRSILS
ncbi:MAG: glycosyltransferase family 1 protein [Caldilineae bacterium]|nr:MAG: glycosyltransferase family 1 protein [Caldilineae bacterium]